MNGFQSIQIRGLVCRALYISPASKVLHKPQNSPSNRVFIRKVLSKLSLLFPGTIGVSEYAQKALGDVVFVELPELETQVDAGESIGAVESVKSASDIMSPISGTIIERNEALDGKPSLINSSAEGSDGWIAKIEVDNEGMQVLDTLMDEEAYIEYTTSEGDH